MFMPTLAGLVLAQSAQHTCPPVAPDAWLRQQPAISTSEIVPHAALVRENEAEALALMEDQEVVALTATQAARFGATGGAADPRLRPYLVRAVAANGGARLMGVERSGDDLVVTTGSLGCPAYIRRAVVVYLDRPPVRVFTSAMTAL